MTVDHLKTSSHDGCRRFGRLRRLLVLLVLSGVLPIAAGCVIRGEPVPAALADQADLPGMPDVRSWSEAIDPALRQSLRDSIEQERAYYAAHPDETRPERVSLLALSGGGAQGAFGAGLLVGWSEAGTRPQFKVVTGVSTGALIAPLAFLGPEYDDELREAYTTIETRDVLRPGRPLLTFLFGGQALADTTPLRRLVARFVDEEVLQAIAREHAKGRRLLIGTTNLDAQRPVIWNMGEIAASGHPRALELFRDVIVASASIPVAFPPVYIEVKAGSDTFEEMHVDGGVVAQVFLFGGGFSVLEEARRTATTPRPIDLYVIRNGSPDPAWQAVTPRLLPIASRSIDTLLKFNGLNDLLRLHAIAVRDGMTFHLAYIPGDLPFEPAEAFDPEYMARLFNLAYEAAAAGYPWREQPPVSLYPRADAVPLEDPEPSTPPALPD
ncbi:MAG TPA: patatin-like phospholipase family protein [Phycisphaeraceae bacterium]